MPDGLLRSVIAMLLEALPRDGLCLELGVGTGRIALPLQRGGMRMAGVDISSEMLRRLAANAQGSPPLVVRADATRLPFGDGSFSSAIAVHVLHLIPEWKSAVDEMVRVVRRGGVFIASRGRYGGDDWAHRVRRRFFVEAGDPPWPPGVDRLEQLDEHMREVSAEPRDLPSPFVESSLCISELVDYLEAGYNSVCWSIDDATRTRAAAAAREWASREYGDLDVARPVIEGSYWRAYRLAEQR